MANPVGKKIDAKSGGGRPYKDVTIIDPNQYDGGGEDEENHDDWIPLNPLSTGDPPSQRTSQSFFSKFRYCPGSRPSSSSSSSSASSPSTLPPVTVGSLWTALVFGWFTPVLQAMQSKLDVGESPNLEEDQGIPPLPHEDSTAAVSDVFEKLWTQELIDNADNPSLVRCLWRAFSPLFISAGFLKLTHDCLQFVGPQVLKGLISFLRDPSEDIRIGLGLTAAVTVAQVIMSLCLRHYFFRCYRVGIRIRTAILYALYQKSLRINATYYQKHPVGQITNLMSVDVERLQGVITYLHAIWYSFLQIVLAMYFLWQQLGPSCLAGVLVIVLSIPLTAVSAQWMGSLQTKLMEKKDARVQANQEIITNMKVVKLQAWEGPFREKITRLRGVEMRQLLIYDLGQACTWLLWSIVPLLIALSTFGAYVAIAGQSLDVATALTALALFEILRFPLFMLPYVINMIVEAGVAVKRIQEFLSAPDYEPPLRLQDSHDHAKKPVVQLSDATFTYQSFDKKRQKSTAAEDLNLQDALDETEQDLLLIKAKLADAEEHLAELEGRPYVRYGSTISSADGDDNTTTKNDHNNGYDKILSLRRVNFECFQGEFVVVVGGVGSGKSTLMRSILGEVQKVSGDVGVRGTIAYFDQKAFIMNDTVRGNIVFGRDGEGGVDEDLYKLAVKSTCLEHDLEMLPSGDETEIGEKVRKTNHQLVLLLAVYEPDSTFAIFVCI
jgi:ABC-type multidrug transport system fused ATPase/permease subunit